MFGERQKIHQRLLHHHHRRRLLATPATASLITPSVMGDTENYL